jgi:hypothetical protein
LSEQEKLLKKEKNAQFAQEVISWLETWIATITEDAT